VQDIGATFIPTSSKRELGCSHLAEATALSALNRTELRAHWREDFQAR
jgi:hypothetical protein